MDFYQELYTQLSSNTEIDEENMCLISHEPLNDTKVELYCKHSFNYIPLFYEVKNQHYGYNSKSMYHKECAIKCPYCRKITNGVLPYLPTIKDVKLYGVNSPKNKCIKQDKCKYVFKFGKNKGTYCNTLCMNGLCSRHEKMKHTIHTTTPKDTYSCIAKLKSGLQCKYSGKFDATKEVIHSITKYNSNKEQTAILKQNNIETLTILSIDGVKDGETYYVCGVHKNICKKI